VLVQHVVRGGGVVRVISRRLVLYRLSILKNNTIRLQILFKVALNKYDATAHDQWFKRPAQLRSAHVKRAQWL